jgi:ArsR family transcriptional regulator
MNIETAASQLEALGNPTRLNIYRTLVRAGGNGLPVGKLQLKLISRPRRCRITSRSWWT